MNDELVLASITPPTPETLVVAILLVFIICAFLGSITNWNMTMA